MGSFTVHGLDQTELNRMRKVSPKLKQVIDKNPALFQTRWETPVLEIKGHPNNSYNCIWYLESNARKGSESWGYTMSYKFTRQKNEIYLLACQENGVHHLILSRFGQPHPTHTLGQNVQIEEHTPFRTKMWHSLKTPLIPIYTREESQAKEDSPEPDLSGSLMSSKPASQINKQQIVCENVQERYRALAQIDRNAWERGRQAQRTFQIRVFHPDVTEL